MDDEFYIRFEERFRGSREKIKDRLKVYLPIIEPLKTIYPDRPIIDLGCGRGEWLELLKENGWQALGVDLSKGMVILCKKLGLTAITEDAIKYLRTVKSKSVSVVSGFHIAEHLTFELLLELVKEAHRALLPCGFLIIETPNPENVLVSSTDFYLDPTHRNPLPPLLMQFLAEDSGFSKSIIMRLNGPNQPENNMTVSSQLAWAIVANPDYALIAQKRIDKNNHEFISYDSVQSEQAIFSTMVVNVFNHYENELNTTKNELNTTKNELNTTKNELTQVYNSRSYRITAPMRAVFNLMRMWRDRFKRKIKKIIIWFTHEIKKRSWLEFIFLYILNRFPGCKLRIKNLTVGIISSSDISPDDPNNLSSRERQIYHDLLEGINQEKRK